MNILPTQRNNLTNDQLCHTPRVGKGTIEHGDAAFGGVFKVNLIGADTETADADEVLGVPEDAFCQFRLGADADGLDVSNLLD